MGSVRLDTPRHNYCPPCTLPTMWGALKSLNKQHTIPWVNEVLEEITRSWNISTEMVRKPVLRLWERKEKKIGTVLELSRSGQPTKIPPSTCRHLIQEVTKEPRQISKHLALFALDKVSIYNSTITERLVNIKYKEKQWGTTNQEEYSRISYLPQIHCCHHQAWLIERKRLLHVE